MAIITFAQIFCHLITRTCT